MKTIDPALLAEMIRRLVAEFQPEQVILFGSHAWGTPSDDSDIDLMVIVTHAEQPEYQRIVRAYQSFGHVIAPTDVLVKTRAEFDYFRNVRASLEHKIAEQGKVLYERSEISPRQQLAA